jgi:hypothetical protein
MDSGNKTIEVFFHWGTRSIVLTIVFSVVLLASCYLAYRIPYVPEMRWLGILKWGTIAFFLICLLSCACNAPISLQANDSGVVIKKLANKITIQYVDIISIAPIDKKELNGSIRLGASDGTFGYWGTFSNNRMGKHKMYGGELKNLLYVETKNRKYVVSCGDMDTFTGYVNNKMLNGTENGN